jgi:hypothetical protein
MWPGQGARTVQPMTELLAFALLAVNPVGGLLAAIPFAVLKADFTPWAVVLTGVPLCYLQVVFVDAGWSRLEKWGWWRRRVERSRGKWAERLVQSRGGFWITFLATPMMGPWMVMAAMRWAGVSQRVVAAPILLSLLASSTVIAGLCVFIPTLFAA